MNGSLDLVERQVAFLERRPDDASFLVQLDPFLRALEGDVIIAGHLDDMRTELLALLSFIEGVDRELTQELVGLRRELAEMRPSADDSDSDPPSDPRSAESAEYMATFAFFDVLVAEDPEPFNAEVEGGRAQVLINVLKGKDELYSARIESADGTVTELTPCSANPIGDPVRQAPEGTPTDDEADPERLDRWRQDVSNVVRRLQHAQRWTRLRLKVSGGHALIALEQARDLVNPDLKLLGPDYTVQDHRTAVLKDMMSGKDLFGFAVNGVSLDGSRAELLSKRVEDLRISADRLREELRQRIGTTRSRVAVVNRFKLRCEWHDRTRMAALAADSSLPGGPEDRLTSELARYLFDNGLSPLSKPLTGGLEPDLLDPAAHFYVEAKQYRKADRAMLRRGFAQVIDTVNKLRGSTTYEVEEAFYVVFRLSGPYYILPATVRAGSLNVHIILIDLAPPEETGRRQKNKPAEVTSEEFLESTAKI